MFVIYNGGFRFGAWCRSASRSKRLNLLAQSLNIFQRHQARGQRFGLSRKPTHRVAVALNAVKDLHTDKQKRLAAAGGRLGRCSLKGHQQDFEPLFLDLGCRVFLADLLYQFTADSVYTLEAQYTQIQRTESHILWRERQTHRGPKRVVQKLVRKLTKHQCPVCAHSTRRKQNSTCIYARSGRACIVYIDRNRKR